MPYNVPDAESVSGESSPAWAWHKDQGMPGASPGSFSLFTVISFLVTLESRGQFAVVLGLQAVMLVSLGGKGGGAQPESQQRAPSTGLLGTDR